jgi:arsenate reductase
MPILIYHNPNCSNSNATLALLREAGHDPHIIQYLETPPTADELKDIVARMDGTLRDIARTKEPLYKELKLDQPGVSDAQLLASMTEHPILINRPIVITDKGVRLCRPPQTVKEIL